MTILVMRGFKMAAWGATKAKAQFSAMLDQVEAEGPQLVRRRKQEFYVLTKEQFLESNEEAGRPKSFVSAWDALAPSSGELFDVDFPRLKSKARWAKF